MARLTDRELATVLAALRFWQEEMLDDGGAYGARDRSPEHFHDVEPLERAEVDALCEELNSVGASGKDGVEKPTAEEVAEVLEWEMSKTSEQTSYVKSARAVIEFIFGSVSKGEQQSG